MRKRFILLLCAGTILPAFLGCGVDTQAVLDAPDAVVVYSIDGNDYDPPEKRPKTAEEFHGYPVLGKVEIADSAARLELVGALKEAIIDGGGAKCFWPRHGVRVARGGQWVDYVICFFCDNVDIYTSSSGARYKEMHVKKPLKPVLNKVLTDAGVPLAPEPFPPSP